jgi:hypothetical protein
MNVPGGGKNDIPNRLKRQFAIFNVPEASNASIAHIFGSFAKVPPIHLSIQDDILSVAASGCERLVTRPAWSLTISSRFKF